MPVKIVNKTFTDQFGTSNTFYRTNSGDRVVATFRLFNNIFVQSGSGNFFQLDPVQNIVTWSGGDFEKEGFRIGQSVTFTKYTSSGSIITSWNTLVTNVNGNQLDVNSIPTWIDATNGEIISILALPVASNNYCLRESVIVQPNHVANQQTGSEFSLIDGESTRFFFDLTQLNGSNSISGVPVGNQSGQFIDYCKIHDKTIAVAGSMGSPTRVWDLEIAFINSGIYSQPSFSTSNCLKFYAKCDFSVFENEPFDKFSLIYNDDADSGWFDEAFNNGILNASIIDSIDEIGFQQPSLVKFIVDAPISGDFGFGFSYIPQTSSYYKNKPQSQKNLAMTIPTTELIVGGFVDSPSNPVGASMRMELVSIVQTGTQFEVELLFTPNAQFTAFMDSQDPDDRLFYVWARFGNINLLVYNGQLIKNPPVGGVLKMDHHLFVDHSENIDNAQGQKFGYESDIEDDLAFIGKFRIPFDLFCDSFTAKIQAWNTSTDESFDLQSVFFDIASIPMVGGKHIINVSQPVINTLPTTSLKRNAVLVLDPTNDNLPDSYGVRIVFPFLNRWEYWLDQLNASVDFFPNDQTKNWLPYDTTGSWVLRLRLELIRDGLLFYFNDSRLLLKDYDANQSIDSNIELYIDSTNQNVGIVTEGQLMRVVGTHTLNDGDIWKQNEIWGMITIEPTESAPRWICSSVVPFDNNTSNPLEPLNGLLCDLTFPSPETARLECYFDPNKINLANGVKFTSKIKGCSLKSILAKQKTDGTFKLKTDGTLKLKTN
jgi:hypothetical protein